MATPQFHSGFLSTSSVAGTELPTISWAVPQTGDRVTFKNSQSGQLVGEEITFTHAEVNIILDQDFANPIMDSPLSLVVGSTYAKIKLYFRQTAKSALNGPGWMLSSGTVHTQPTTCAVDGKPGLSVGFVVSPGATLLWYDNLSAA